MERTELRKSFFMETRLDPYAHMVTQLYADAWATGYEQALRLARRPATRHQRRMGELTSVATATGDVFAWMEKLDRLINDKNLTAPRVFHVWRETRELIEERLAVAVTVEEAALVRKVLATTGYAAPMHERHEARRIVDRFLPAMSPGDYEGFRDWPNS